MRTLERLAADATRSWRRLLTTPVYFAFGVFSVTCGITTVTLCYSVVTSTLTSTSGIRDASHVVALTRSDTRFGPAFISGNDYRLFRDTQTSLSQLSAAEPGIAALTSPSGTHVTPLSVVDGAYFPLLGVQPIIGRLIDDDDVRSGASVAVLSYRLWRSRFGGDANLIGQELQIAGQWARVIGVTPSAFTDPVDFGNGGQIIRVWMPRREAGAFRVDSFGYERSLVVVGRVRSGVAVSAASAEVRSRGEQIGREARSPRLGGGYWGLRQIESLQRERSDNSRLSAALVTLAVVAFVAACTNLGSLAFARGVSRRKEFAIRRAMGGSRWSIVREQLLEGAAIVVTGFVVSAALLTLASRATGVEVPIYPTGSLWIQPQANSASLSVAALAAFVALGLFSLEPAMRVSREAYLNTDLSEPGSVSAATLQKVRQRTLVRWQSAAAAFLFVLASFGAEYLVRFSRHDCGLALDGLAVATLGIRSTLSTDHEGIRQEQLESLLHGVDGAGLSVANGMPFGLNGTERAMFLGIDNKQRNSTNASDTTRLIGVDERFFGVAGIRIVQGRALTEADGARDPLPIVISRATADSLFGAASALGRAVTLQRGSRGRSTVVPAVVVGLSEDTDTTHYGLRDDNVTYVPLRQGMSGTSVILLRSRTSTESISILHKTLREFPSVAVVQLGTARAVLTGSIPVIEILAKAASTLGLLTLMLGSIGLYGLQTFMVDLRSREIGIRMAVGATRSSVASLVLKDGFRPVVEGLAIGLFIGVAVRAIIRASWITPVPILDSWMIVLPSATLLASALLASCVPAVRAASLAPARALHRL